MCLIQTQKLGLVGPFGESPDHLVRTLQSMWADNGDAISRQYAGTDALKGDVTRSGQRKIVGMVRDGYTSASRYYLSHMRDSQRQLAIDALLNEVLVGGWALVDGSHLSDQIDTVLLLTRYFNHKHKAFSMIS
uniref:SAC domain-containing protein n=1 Tax=Parascaris equorum TaxID=6256 RepID=A0A914R9B9_PAREQ